MRWLRAVIMALIAGLLQVSLLGSVRMDGVVPNLVLVLVVCMAVWGSASEAILMAVIAGFMLDVAGSSIFGLAISSLVLIALMVAALRQIGVHGELLPMRVLLIIGATALWGFIHIIAIGVGNFAFVATWHVLALEMVLNCILMLACPERIFRSARTV